MKQQLINSDCVAWMQQQPANSIDSVVTDPPYGLEFMGSEWDTFSVRLPREVLNARRFKQLIKLVTPPTSTTLDPFVGSGTACLAAIELDTCCIGIEASEDYYKIALARPDHAQKIIKNKSR